MSSGDGRPGPHARRGCAASHARLRLKANGATRRWTRTWSATSESYHRADGAAAMEALLALPQPPDAVFCFNDLLALGALRTLRDHGLRVPEDVAVAGFDDIEECAYSTPSLTTVSPDKAAIAAMAVDLLASRLDGGRRRRGAPGAHRAVPARRAREHRRARGPSGHEPAASG